MAFFVVLGFITDVGRDVDFCLFLFRFIKGETEKENWGCTWNIKVWNIKA